MKVLILNLVRLVYISLVNLNIFLLRDFGSKIDRMTVKRFGQWATRLYIVLYVVSVAVLTIYTIVEPQTLTKTFDKLSVNLCNQLFQRYGNELKCSCSSVASKYNRFVEIEAEFHEVRQNYSNLLKIRNKSEMKLFKEDQYLHSKYFH